MTKLYVALVHHPVVNRQGDTIASAVTNLDLHDIARSAKTYGAEAFYVVTPLVDQKELVEKIVSHWTCGVGATQNPKRREALELIRTVDSLGQVCRSIEDAEGRAPETVVTSARKRPEGVSFQRLRKRLQTDGGSLVLVFGTGWGLAEELMTAADHVLEPVTGPTDYNHLSVRAAVAIILDRLMCCD